MTIDKPKFKEKYGIDIVQDEYAHAPRDIGTVQRQMFDDDQARKKQEKAQRAYINNRKGQIRPG